MREALKKVRNFANYERKIEAVEYIYQISIRRQMFESLIQWVKVVYANELKNKQSGNKENSLNILMDSNGNFCRS
jgi:hypothetical protein